MHIKDFEPNCNIPDSQGQVSSNILSYIGFSLLLGVVIVMNSNAARAGNFVGRTCSRNSFLVVSAWILPEVVHSLSVTVPFTSTLLTMIAHPMLHCWSLIKVNLVVDFGASNNMLLSPTGW